MKVLWAVLLLILLGLQYRIWFGAGSLAEINSLQRRIAEQEVLNAAMEARNGALEIEVRELQTGTEGFEEKAREEMGMIKKGETFFLYLAPGQDESSTQ